MECLVYRRGEAVGTLKIEEDGLYWMLIARIPAGPEILRLYVPEPVGVFVPEGDELTCRRRITRARLPTLPSYASAWCEADALWSSEEDGMRRRYTQEGTQIALRWQTDAPMAFPAAPDRLKPIVIEGTVYLTCLLPYGDQ